MHAAAALATYDSFSPRWKVICAEVAQALTRVKPEFLGDWKEALRPIRSELFAALGVIFRDRELGELQQALATSTLADYAADVVSLLADLIVDADPRQFAELFPVLARHGEGAIHALETELDEVVRPDWTDPPTDPSWRDLTADLRQVIEAAAGLLEERFIFCQTLPYPQFRDVVEQLRGRGYRPLRIRPHRVGPSLQVAAVWIRDGRSWEWLGEADVEDIRTRDTELGRQGYVPVDVSVTRSGEGGPPCYAAVWEKNGADTEVRLIVGRLGESEQKAQAALVEQRFNCQTATVILDCQGQPHGASLWTRRNDQQRSTTRLFHGPSADFREDDCPGLLLTDARLSSIEVPEDGGNDSILVTTALWNISTQFESKVLHGLSIIEQRLLAARLTADGFRPVAISVASDPENGLPVAASVWHRPLAAESAKDRLAKRQANAAVALLRLGQRAQGLADSPASPRPQDPQLFDSPAQPPRRGSEPGSDPVGQTG